MRHSVVVISSLILHLYIKLNYPPSLESEVVEDIHNLERRSAVTSSVCESFRLVEKMSFNKIVSSQMIKTLTNTSGKTLTVKYAIKTSNWDRSFLAQDDFCSALEKTSDLPADATIAILA